MQTGSMAVDPELADKLEQFFSTVE